MAVAMKMRWEGVTPDQYDAVREKVDWDSVPAAGGLYHVAWFNDTGLTVVDVWESESHFNTFMEERLGPALAEIGVEGEPKVAFHEVHNYFNAESAQAAV
jgi:hypothetical protein